MSFPHSWLITGLVTILIRWVPLVEQELLALQEHLSLPTGFLLDSCCSIFSFVDRYFLCCTFSFGHCVVCSSIYGFWLPIWYLQTLLLLLLGASMSFPHSWLITGLVSRVTRWVPLMEQELLALQGHLSLSVLRFTNSFYPFVARVTRQMPQVE